MKKSCSVILCTVLMLLVFVNLGFAAESKDKKTVYKWRLGTCHTEGPYVDFANKFCDYTNKYSNGRMKIKNYSGDLLGDWVHQLESCAVGTQEMAISWPASNVNPKLDVTWVPYVFFTWEQAMQATKPGGWYLKMLEPLYAEAGLYPFAVVPNQFATVGSNKKIQPYTPDNIKKQNFKLRVPPLMAVKAWADGIGYNSQTVPLSEVEIGLKQGMVDGTSCNDHQQIWDCRDLLKYEYLDKESFIVMVATMNLKIWKSLSKEDQKIISKAAEMAISDVGTKFSQVDILEKIKRSGKIQVVEISNEELRACAKVSREKTWDEIEKKLVGKKLMDIVRANAAPLP